MNVNTFLRNLPRLGNLDWETSTGKKASEACLLSLSMFSKFYELVSIYFFYWVGYVQWNPNPKKLETLKMIDFLNYKGMNSSVRYAWCNKNKTIWNIFLRVIILSCKSPLSASELHIHRNEHWNPDKGQSCRFERIRRLPRDPVNVPFNSDEYFLMFITFSVNQFFSRCFIHFTDFSSQLKKVLLCIIHVIDWVRVRMYNA